jgi:hypothetical protein
VARLSPPPPSLRLAISAGLLGAVLIARGKGAGLALVEATSAGAWRSFIAAAICLPALLALRGLAWAEDGLPAAGALRPLIAELIAYVVGWVAFPLLTLPLVDGWGRGAQWARFIAAWNWLNVVQYVMWLALALAVAVGLPRLLLQGLSLAGFGYVLWLEWFCARAALGVGGGRAAALVGLDLAIGVFLAGLVQRLAAG